MTQDELAARYDGQIPPAEWAAARWGAGAWERLARGADAAVVEARLRECVSALGRLRRSSARGRAVGALECLARIIADYRRESLTLQWSG